jgi:antitoxin HicB
MNRPPAFERYPFNVEPLVNGEGGGYVITFPDLPGCMSDGNTVDEAIAPGRRYRSIWAVLRRDYR